MRSEVPVAIIKQSVRETYHRNKAVSNYSAFFVEKSFTSDVKVFAEFEFSHGRTELMRRGFREACGFSYMREQILGHVQR